MFKKMIIPTEFATCVYPAVDAVKTKNGLAVSPSTAMAMAERGIPISAQMSSDFYDGDDNPSWELPLERSRGIDPSDLWQMQQDSRSKIRKAVKQFKNSLADAQTTAQTSAAPAASSK